VDRYRSSIMRLANDAAETRTHGIQLLAQHHRDLDARFERLVAGAREGDPVELRNEWSAFERELLRHLELEEAEILPAFARHHAAEARAILVAHAEIRSALLEMGLNLDLHVLRADRVEAFVQQLEAHARREEAAFYAWAERHLPATDWHAIKRGLQDVAKRAS